MRDSADGVENRRNQVSAEPAPQKAALHTDKVRVGTPQGCAGEVSFSEFPTSPELCGAQPSQASRPHANKNATRRGASVATFPARARPWRAGPLPPLLVACTR